MVAAVQVDLHNPTLPENRRWPPSATSRPGTRPVARSVVECAPSRMSSRVEARGYSHGVA